MTWGEKRCPEGFWTIVDVARAHGLQRHWTAILLKRFNIGQVREYRVRLASGKVTVRKLRVLSPRDVERFRDRYWGEVAL